MTYNLPFSCRFIIQTSVFCVKRNSGPHTDFLQGQEWTAINPYWEMGYRVSATAVGWAPPTIFPTTAFLTAEDAEGRGSQTTEGGGHTDECLPTAKYANHAKKAGRSSADCAEMSLRGAQRRSNLGSQTRFSAFGVPLNARHGRLLRCARNDMICGYFFLNHECPPGAPLHPSHVARSHLRLRRRFFLAFSARTRHNTLQWNTPDEAATNELEPDVGRTDVVRSK
jgi:hypothetical protein